MKRVTFSFLFLLIFTVHAGFFSKSIRNLAFVTTDTALFQAMLAYGEPGCQEFKERLGVILVEKPFDAADVLKLTLDEKGASDSELKRAAALLVAHRGLRVFGCKTIEEAPQQAKFYVCPWEVYCASDQS